MPGWRTLIVVQDTPHVSTLILNRPERRNAIDARLAAELVDALSELAGQRGLRVLVLTGEGTAFSAGGDLKERLACGPKEAREQRDAALRATELLDRFPCPVIAMINGAALAGGFELALACDIRVASEDAFVGLPEVRTSGGFPGAGGPARLASLIGRGRASLAVYTGRQFPAREAFDLGMVDVLVPAARLRDEVASLAAQIAANSPAAVSAAKQLIRESADLDRAAATSLSRELRDPMDESADFREAMDAWRARRIPNYPDR
ncbi:MAG: enoyl-CoA hydratase/isomerase family protein [Burkholderiaceae bacterium]|nr:enoyl-CoA hydratase/isomerase family protein [Burkholderiaceae bacterium]